MGSSAQPAAASSWHVGLFTVYEMSLRSNSTRLWGHRQQREGHKTAPAAERGHGTPTPALHAPHMGPGLWGTTRVPSPAPVGTLCPRQVPTLPQALNRRNRTCAPKSAAPSPREGARATGPALTTVSWSDPRESVGSQPACCQSARAQAIATPCLARHGRSLLPRHTGSTSQPAPALWDSSTAHGPFHTPCHGSKHRRLPHRTQGCLRQRSLPGAGSQSLTPSHGSSLPACHGGTLSLPSNFPRELPGRDLISTGHDAPRTPTAPWS